MESNVKLEMTEDPALNNIQANHYPLMRRFDQHFTVENKLHTYDSDISRLSALNKRALATIKKQEQRLKEIRNQMRPRVELNQRCNTEPTSVMTPSAEEVEPMPKNDEPKTVVLTNHGDKRQFESNILVGKRDEELESPEIETLNEVVPKVNVASVGHDSFTLEWEVDTSCNLDNIYDVEIRYSYTVSGEEKIVQHSCSNWAKKQLGWSDFTIPVKRIICSGEWVLLSLPTVNPALAHLSQTRQQQMIMIHVEVSFCIA